MTPEDEQVLERLGRCTYQARANSKAADPFDAETWRYAAVVFDQAAAAIRRLSDRVRDLETSLGMGLAVHSERKAELALAQARELLNRCLAPLSTVDGFIPTPETDIKDFLARTKQEAQDDG